MPEERTLPDMPGSDWFWSIIEEVGGDQELPEAELQARAEAVLQKLSDKQLKEFYYEHYEVSNELYPSRTIPERGMNEDGVELASLWVIAQGRKRYLEVWQNPALLPDAEELPYRNCAEVAAEIYWRRTGKSIPD
jgi:hypothetical protein